MNKVALDEREAYIQAHIAICSVSTRTKLSPGNHTSGISISIARSKRRCARKSWARHVKESA